MEALSDWTNPILVKETRQALKSRQFVVTFMLLLAASWLISLFGLLLAGADIEYGAIGTRFFSFYFMVLAFAVVVVVPFGAYRSLLLEREQTTYELLSITTLSPRQVIWGKLLSAGLQVFIFYSAIAPFIAFTSLMQGFDIIQVAFMLVFALLVSLIVSMAALMISAMARHKLWQVLTSLGVLGGLFLAFGMVASLMGDLTFRGGALGERDFWWGMGIALVAAISYFFLFQQIATVHLTFESDNQATGVRLVLSAQSLLLWVGLVALAYLSGTFFSTSNLDEGILVCAVLSALHWGAVGLFVATEDEYLSRRIRRNLPRNHLLRVLMAPLLPGGSRGFLYLVLNVAAFAAAGCWLAKEYAPAQPQLGSFVLGCACYVLIYVGVGCAVGRWAGALSHDIRPGHVRVLTLILLAIGCIGPYLPYLFGVTYRSSYSPVMISNPLPTLDQLGDGRAYHSTILTVLLIAAGVAVLINVPAMRRGLAEVVFADVKGGALPERGGRASE
jgi:hypothetical protein